VLGVSLPSYVFGLLLAYFVGYKAQIFPLLYDNKHPGLSSVMPVIALAMFTVATVARFTRGSMLEVLDSEYMLLAESKGITGWRLILRHAMRNALIPVITVLAPLVVDLMIGSLVIEQIFSIPGIGAEFVTSVSNRDYTLIMALTIFYGAFIIVANIVTDLITAAIDPRIRLS
jgi:oligopeptide transport system permease protein